jgi:hypothetical protein
MTDIRQFDAPAADGGSPPEPTHVAKEQATQIASTAVDQGRQTAGAAAGAAGQAVGTATEGAKQVASEAAQQAGRVTQQAADQARDLVTQAQTQLHDQAQTQTQRAADGLTDVSGKIRALSEGRVDQAGFAADTARQLADKVEELAGRIQQRGFDGTVADLRSFARRRPGMFLLSAAAGGFVVGRLGRGAQVGEDGSSGRPAAGAPTPPPTALTVPPPPAMPPPGTPEPYLPPTTTLPSFDGGA